MVYLLRFLLASGIASIAAAISSWDGNDRTGFSIPPAPLLALGIFLVCVRIGFTVYGEKINDLSNEIYKPNKRKPSIESYGTEMRKIHKCGGVISIEDRECPHCGGSIEPMMFSENSDGHKKTGDEWVKLLITYGAITIIAGLAFFQVYKYYFVINDVGNSSQVSLVSKKNDISKLITIRVQSVSEDAECIAREGIFCTQSINLGKLLVSATIQNASERAIKDLKVKCQNISRSGKILDEGLIYDTDIVIYDIWMPHESSNVTFKISNAEQRYETRCQLSSWAYVN